MRFKRGILLTFLVLLSAPLLLAQIGSGGQPNISPAQTSALNQSIKTMPSLPNYVSKQNSTSPKENAQALRFAHPFFVDYTTSNSGVWSTLDNGQRVWHLAIKSEGAYSINLIFDRFELADGASLFIFNTDQSVILGAYTFSNNSESGVLATSPIPGETVIIELQEPINSHSASELLIGAVNHDFIDLFSTLSISSQRFQYSDNCHPEFTCDENQILAEAGQSVCRIIFDGTLLCSGTLLNNTKNDGTPYVLTAAHCISSSTEFQTTLFTFNYQVPNCVSFMEGSFSQSLSGSKLRSYAWELDMALLEMNEIPPATFRPVWGGWSRSTTIDVPVTTIHHPEGDVKKSAYSEMPPTKSSFYLQEFEPDSHWRVARWQNGTTEGGSSGAPLLDDRGLLIGHLSGGSSNCYNPVNDHFSRFEKSWSFYSDPAKQLAAWLDPLELNPTSLNSTALYATEMKRLSNFSLADTPIIHKLTLEEGFGYWAGHNSRKDIAMAELFGPFGQGLLHGVWLMPSVSQNQNNQSIALKIWKGDYFPQQKIAEIDDIKLNLLKSNREHLVALDNPISITGNIWVEVSLNYSSTTDTLALYSSAKSNLHSNNTFWLKNASSEWIEGESLTGFASSIWVDLMVSGAVLVDSVYESPFNQSLTISPNPVWQTATLFWGNRTGRFKTSIFTIGGEKIKESNLFFNEGVSTLNVEALQSGLYILFLTSAKEIATVKFIVR